MDSQTIKRRLRELGADLVGIAPAERLAAAPKGHHPCDILPGCRSVIVFACRFPAGPLDCASTVPYTVTRNILSNRMDQMAVQFCTELETAGVLAVPTSTNSFEIQDPDTGRWRAPVSAKHCAAAAGLGRIGRNTLLITPKFGNMVWLSVILTTAALAPDPPLPGEACPENCHLCETVCPVHAIDGPELKQMTCFEHAFDSGTGEQWIVCFQCRRVCPHCFGTENAQLK